MAINEDWEKVYVGVCAEGLLLHDMPEANHVWGSYLRKRGYARYIIPNSCPDCYTIEDFCEDNPNDVFILGTGSHVVAVINGDYYDTWDSGQSIPIYYWRNNDEL